MGIFDELQPSFAINISCEFFEYELVLCFFTVSVAVIACRFRNGFFHNGLVARSVPQIYLIFLYLFIISSFMDILRL